ncbi:MAG TPA: twin-arginine translocase subunit TatC [Acidimicrobiia bacterium]|nr:twin-arginine translocase subunit TatC [Acidimicrobiia bacterium]HIL05100.1 twin-arginine translocase subunit TatC [Acidimicrobiia bacterium]
MKLRRRPASGPVSFWDHIAELRVRLIWSVLAVLAGAVIGLFFYDWMLGRFFLPPYCNVLEAQGIDKPCTLVIIEPLDGFKTRIRVSLYVGVVLAMPVMLWHLWRFVTPALDRREKRYAIPFVLCALLLFVCGAILAYSTFERALDFLISFGGESVDPMFSPGAYLGLITYMMLAFGIGFEFPILLVFLQIAGVVKPAQLHRLRRYAIVGIVTLAAILTPSGDPVSLAALSIPMYVFFELSILVGRLLTRQPGRRLLFNRTHGER